MESKINALINTLNFESTALTVFNRLILETGPGLLVLWGGNQGDTKKANKSYFLDMVEAFELGVSPAALDILPDSLQNLLQQLDPRHYQCVRVKGDCPSLAGNAVYSPPLSVTVPLTIAGAANRRGLASGRNLVILCDDMQEFMKYNTRANERYLQDLSMWLKRQSVVTFLGASRLTWNAKTALASDPSDGDHVLPLGWD